MVQTRQLLGRNENAAFFVKIAIDKFLNKAIRLLSGAGEAVSVFVDVVLIERVQHIRERRIRARAFRR